MSLLIHMKCPAIEGFRRKKQGRFIPCRGGGTATTYYTDFQDVDEDSKTIVRYGGDWINGTQAGITFRHMDHTPADTSDYVASRLIYLS